MHVWLDYWKIEPKRTNYKYAYLEFQDMIEHGSTRIGIGDVGCTANLLKLISVPPKQCIQAKSTLPQNS